MNLIAYDLFHLGKKLTSSHVRNKNEEILVFSAGSFCLLLTSFFWFLLYCTRNACLIFGSVGCIFELWTFWFLCTGHKYFYNTRTHVSQWEPPASLQKPAATNSNNAVTQSTANGKGEHPPSQLPRCSGCGGWGVGLVQRWGYCVHCTRVFNLPEKQFLPAHLNHFTNAGDSGQKDPNQRYASLKILDLEKIFFYARHLSKIHSVP